jgi:hypothetical protein
VSSVNLGLLYSEGENVSEARLNAKSIFSGSGAEIAGLPPTKQIPIVICRESGDGFLQDEAYFQSSDGLSYLNFRRMHLHNEDTDVAGGSLNSILQANPKQIIVNLPYISTNHVRNYKHADGALTDVSAPSDSNYISVASGNASGEYNNIFIGGLQMGFAKSVLMIIKMQLSHNSNIVFRTGVGMEWVNSSTDNTMKIGLEGCNGTGEEIQVVTASGLGRTATPTDSNMVGDPAQLRGYKLLWDPITAAVHYEDSDGNTKPVTDTLPSSGSIAASKLWRFGVDTTNTTVKTGHVSGLLVLGETQDPVWDF